MRRHYSYIQLSAFLSLFLSNIDISVVLAVISVILQRCRPYTILLWLSILFKYLNLDFCLYTSALLFICCQFLIRFWKMQLLCKGKFQVGFIQSNHFCVFYPSSECKREIQAYWALPCYMRTMYDIHCVDPAQWHMPYLLFRMLMSFILTVKMPFGAGALVQQESYPVIIFSHGLGSHSRHYAMLCGWWASHGYIVVSPQHSHDRIVLDYRKHVDRKHFLYVNRNKDLQVRVQQFLQVYRNLQSILTQTLSTRNIGDVYFSGHSYGGATAIEAAAEVASKDIRVLGLDPWFFPLSETTYDKIKDIEVKIINSQTFFKCVPREYEMEDKMNRIKCNCDKFEAVMIRGTNHLSPSDPTFVLGTLLNPSLSNGFIVEKMEVHLEILQKYMQKKTAKEIVMESNSKDREKKGIIVEIENRFHR